MAHHADDVAETVLYRLFRGTGIDGLQGPVKKRALGEGVIIRPWLDYTKAELSEIFPPITRNNFAVRENWYGRNQIITFVNNKGQQITYNHDEVLKVMLPKLKLMPCWIKRKYWSQSTDMPSNVRDVVIERIDLTA